MADKKFEPLKCAYCKKDVLNSEEGGLLVQIEHVETKKIDDIYVCCDGECYDMLRELRVGEMEIDKWQDIDELKNPVLFLQFVMDILDKMYNGMQINEDVFENLKMIIIKTAQYVMREMSEDEKDYAVARTMERIKYEI